MSLEDNLESLFACSSPRVTISMFSQFVFGDRSLFSKPREHTPTSSPAASPKPATFFVGIPGSLKMPHLIICFHNWQSAIKPPWDEKPLALLLLPSKV